MSDSARDWYREGVASHYREHGRDYANPHAPIVRALLDDVVPRWSLDLAHVLDLACGAGEVTVALRDSVSLRDRATRIDGIDPFTGDAYRRATGQPCEPISFEQIAAGALRGRRYSLVVCSFAMHLCPESMLPALGTELAQVTPRLLILTPHKRPALRESHGWTLSGERIRERVRARLYTSRLIDELPNTPP
jgi:hypothetical protein